MLPLLLLLLNTLSFLTCIPYLSHRAHLSTYRKTRSSHRMAYLIPGFCHNPKPAFNFLIKDIQYGITFVCPQFFGWDAQTIAQQITHDIIIHNYQATIYTIGLGDKIARYIEDTIPDRVRIVSIDPCSTPRLLKWPRRILYNIILIIFAIFTGLLGWFSIFPVVPVTSDHYSLYATFCQFASLVRERPPCRHTSRTRIGFSTHGTPLHSARLYQLFPHHLPEPINAPYGETLRFAIPYHDAVKTLLKQF